MDGIFIAHRGESFDAPENTLSSVNLAWERGAEAVEIDVHLSKDNEIVVIHDANTQRTGGFNKKVNHQTLEELKLLDFGSWKDIKFKNERIPTLTEVIHTIPEHCKLIVEIKSGKNLLPFLKNEIEEFKVSPNQLEIISFDYTTVKLAKDLIPQYNVLFLAELDYSWLSRFVSPSVDNLIKKAKNVNLDGLNVWAGKKANENFIKSVKNAGLKIYVWTVNDPGHAKRLLSWGVDGITTDRAQWIKDQIK